MQLDMHYYGTYAMARAAGLNTDAAKIIATCAQFVDDNTARSAVNFRDGSRIDSEATAHHMIDGANLDESDQRRVWVPFHFLPGNIGDKYTERLKCRIDSAIAQEMRDHYLSFAKRDFGLALMGIAAHVYADTFSHYGFSGVSSRGNKIENSSFLFHEDVEGLEETIEDLSDEMRNYITAKAEAFFAKPGEETGGVLKNIVSWLGEEASGALGHGSVATYPDRPYLAWSFEYERDDAEIGGVLSVRNNPVTFLQGCRALHSMFQSFSNVCEEKYGSGDGREFNEIEETVLGILAVQGSKEDRITAWQGAAQEGSVFGQGGEAIPVYEGDTWNELWEDFDGNESHESVMDSPVWHFYQAASLHRTFIIRDLLPKHGLIID
jgi:hypothetical protein